MLVKVGALLAILLMPTQFALDLQLLGGLWILQTLPALVFGLYLNWFSSKALLVGWAVGLVGGSMPAWSMGWLAAHHRLRNRRHRHLHQAAGAGGQYRGGGGGQPALRGLQQAGPAKSPA